MKKIKKKLLTAMLYTICWRNVDKLYDIWAYDSYNIKLGGSIMRIIRRSKMPDGTLIQVENWKEDYLHIKTLIIATYPISKNCSKSGFIKKNEHFRLKLTGFTSDEQAKSIFEQLEEGRISLKDLKKYFSNGKKDEFYLGLSDSE